MPASPQYPFNITFNEEMYGKLNRLAEKEKKSKAQVVREALERQFRRKKI